MFRVARRRFLAWLASVASVSLLPTRSRAAENDLAPLIAGITDGVPVRSGRVRLETAPLADNGHSVPIRVSVDSPMTAAEHVVSISILSDRNPRPLIATYHLGPRAGRASVSTRVRLNGTQRVHAIAKLSDGSCWSGGADVVVTESACLDET